jgi:hypothetical protein
VFLPMRSFGIVPDYLITRHAFIFEKRRYGYSPHVLWNFQVLLSEWRNHWQVRQAIPLMRRCLRRRIPYYRTITETRERICFRFDDINTAAFAAEILRGQAAPYRFLRVFHHLKEVDIRTVPFAKGFAVAELARHLQIPKRRILVIGDGHNDISMMEVNTPCYAGCPSNAAPEVIETVHQVGGHIAAKSSLGGVMEILDAYATGQVRSALPAGWCPPATVANPVHTRPPREGMSADTVSSFLLFMAAVYTTLIVLASYDIVPFSSTILKPYLKLVHFIEQVVHHLFPGR